MSTSVFETFCEREIMEKELNYLRSEIAKIRMEKEKAQFSNTGWLDCSKHNKTGMHISMSISIYLSYVLVRI